MSTSWDKFKQCKRVEALANKLGFEMAAGRDKWNNSAIYLLPLDDKLPHYSRGAEIYQGTVEDIDEWLKGIEWAREYDNMLKLSNDKKRANCENVERNRQLMQMVKTGKNVDGAYIGPSTYANGLEKFGEFDLDYDANPFIGEMK